MQFQRGPDGQSIPASGYPPIPEAEQFFTGWKYEKPVQIHYWVWRNDYSQWGALVTFADGTCCITNPEPVCKHVQ